MLQGILKVLAGPLVQLKCSLKQRISVVWKCGYQVLAIPLIQLVSTETESFCRLGTMFSCGAFAVISRLSSKLSVDYLVLTIPSSSP